MLRCRSRALRYLHLFICLLVSYCCWYWLVLVGAGAAGGIWGVTDRNKHAVRMGGRAIHLLGAWLLALPPRGTSGHCPQRPAPQGAVRALLDTSDFFFKNFVESAVVGTATLAVVGVYVYALIVGQWRFCCWRQP